jgi:hypothetical protein
LMTVLILIKIFRTTRTLFWRQSTKIPSPNISKLRFWEFFASYLSKVAHRQNPNLSIKIMAINLSNTRKTWGQFFDTPKLVFLRF